MILADNFTNVPLSSKPAGIVTHDSSVTVSLVNQNTVTFDVKGAKVGITTLTAGPVNLGHDNDISDRRGG